MREGVPYVLAAQRSFYARKEIRDALAYLQLLRSNDSIALERVINVPPRKIGVYTIGREPETSRVGDELVLDRGPLWTGGHGGCAV